MSNSEVNSYHSTEISKPMAPVYGTAVSGILVLTATIALGIIFGLNPSIAANFSQLVAWSAVGGSSLVVLIACSIWTCYTRCKREKEETPLSQESEVTSSYESDTEEEETLSSSFSKQNKETSSSRRRSQLFDDNSTLKGKEKVRRHTRFPSSDEIFSSFEENHIRRFDFNPQNEVGERSNSTISIYSDTGSVVINKAEEEDELDEEQVEASLTQTSSITKKTSLTVDTNNFVIKEEEEVEIEVTYIKTSPLTVEKIRTDLINHLFDAFEGVVYQIVTAHSHLTGSKVSEEKLNNAFDKVKNLTETCSQEPRFYLKELIRAFGRGKHKPSVGLRRLIMAFNSGNQKYLKKAQAEYEAIKRGNDLSKLIKYFNSNHSNKTLLKNFPALMENHFSLDDNILQKMGRELLDKIFSKPTQEVRDAFEELRNYTKSDKALFAKKVEKFMCTAFEKAVIDNESLEKMSKSYVEHMIKNHLNQTMRKILGMVARNIRLLPYMFKSQADNEELFPKIDETFLLSEGSDYLTPETIEIQKSLIRLQSKLNYGRKETEKISFLALKENEKRNYSDIVRLCRNANKGNFILKHGEEEKVKELSQKLKVKIVTVPISISDHPFKKIRDKLDLKNIPQRYTPSPLKSFVSWVTNGACSTLFSTFSGFIPDLVIPGLAEMLPKFKDKDKKDFDRFVRTMMELLLRPVFDGTFNDNSKFRRPFVKVIEDIGIPLADRLDELLAQEEFTIEDIREVWENGVKKVADGFEALKQ